MPLLNEIAALAEELAEHPVYSNPYFDLLRKSPWSQDAYALHRANFLHRTEITAKSITHLCARAADEDDRETLVFFSRVNYEEWGSGELECCHAILMERAHNVFGKVVFGLEPLTTRQAAASPLVIDATRQYRKRMYELCSGGYPRLLGAAMALESHAETMLTVCRDAFRFHADKFATDQFVHDCEVYFNCHLESGVEERHAADARRCVEANCRTAEDFEEIRYGAMGTLAVQNAMWQELYLMAIAHKENAQ